MAYLLIAEITWNLTTLGEMGVATLLVVIAGSFPLPVAPKVKTDVTTAVIFAAALLLEPGAAALVATIGVVTYTYFRLRLPWYKYPFNAGVVALYVGAASLVFHTLASQDALLSPAVVPAAAIMYGMNTVLISIAASLQMKANPVRFWVVGTIENGPAELALLAFGFLGGLLYRESPWTILVLFIPVAIIYLAFSRLARTNADLQDALGRLEALQGRIANDAKLTSIGALSVDMAHQIKNPLAIVMGRLEILKDHLEKDGIQHLRQVNIALGASRRIQELTENFTSMGQRKSIEMDVPTLLHEAFGMAALQHHRKVETRWELPEDLPKVIGNPVLIREALSNILANALDAVSDGGLITTSVSRIDTTIIVKISDDGVGIPQEMKEHLFEPFYSSKPNGSGLGLFAAKHILEMHQGSVEVESTEGHGTSVTVTLPAVKHGNQNGHQLHRQDDSDIRPLGPSR